MDDFEEIYDSVFSCKEDGRHTLRQFIGNLSAYNYRKLCNRRLFRIKDCLE